MSENDEIVLEKPTVIMLFFFIFWLKILKDFVKIKKPLLSCSNNGTDLIVTYLFISLTAIVAVVYIIIIYCYNLKRHGACNLKQL